MNWEYPAAGQCLIAEFDSNNMKTLKYLLLSLFIVNQLHAQIDISPYVNPSAQLNTADIDTIELARNCAYQKEFQTADQLLTIYNSHHTDLHGISLHAQVIYWMKDFDRSVDLYENAIKLFPNPSSLHLDYARVLFSMNKMPKVRKLLREYREFDSTNVEAAIMTAYIALWNGKNGHAGKIADQLLQKYPGNAEASDIINKINDWTVPYLKVGTQFLSDDQPVKGQAYYAEAGVYKSWLFAPTVQAAIYRFNAQDSSFHSSWVQLGNTIKLGIKNQLKLKGGFFQQNGKSSEFSGSAELSRQITRSFSLQAGIDRRPYQYTISSIKNVVMENASTVSLSYNRKDKWFGKMGYESCQYGDDNKITVAYLWVVAPIISTPHFSLSGGYAYRHADAKNSTFISKESMSDVISNWPPVNGIAGVYSPYFTPENQQSHSALASIKIIPSKKFQFRSSLNIAFAAKADNPYLYVDIHDSGLFFNKGFAPVDYTPTSWTNELSFAVTKKFYITANYNYDKLLYYIGHRGSMELKYVFAK